MRKALLLIAVSLGGCSPAGLAGFAAFANGYQRGAEGLPPEQAETNPYAPLPPIGPQRVSCTSYQVGFEVQTDCQ